MQKWKKEMLHSEESTVFGVHFIDLALDNVEGSKGENDYSSEGSDNSVTAGETLLFPKPQILDCSKLKEFADNNFKFDENGRKLSKGVANTVGKGEIACDEQFLLFPVFSKDLCCRHIKTRACLGKG